jgi:hypothetical protein
VKEISKWLNWFRNNNKNNKNENKNKKCVVKN